MLWFLPAFFLRLSTWIHYISESLQANLSQPLFLWPRLLELLSNLTVLYLLSISYKERIVPLVKEDTYPGMATQIQQVWC